MKVIIAGSRHITNPEEIDQMMAASGFEVTEVICGLADGPDKLGKAWAIARGIPVTEFEANWRPNGRFDKTAGFQRNTKMGLYAAPDGALALCWDGESDGSAHMLQFARRCKLKIFQRIIQESTQP